MIRVDYMKLLTFAVFAFPAAGMAFQGDARVPAFRLLDSVVSLRAQPSRTGSDCLSVTSDGRFHMETRLQILPAPTSTLRVYEGRLSSNQMKDLGALLERTEFRNLPPVKRPQISPSNDYIRVVRVELDIGSKYRLLGYSDWSGASVVRDGSSAEQTRLDQQAERALDPLISWFRAFKSGGLKETKAEPTHCGGRFTDLAE